MVVYLSSREIWALRSVLVHDIVERNDIRALAASRDPLPAVCSHTYHIIVSDISGGILCDKVDAFSVLCIFACICCRVCAYLRVHIMGRKRNL